jgi:hypothetical protein
MAEKYLLLPESTIEVRRFNYNKWWTDTQKHTPIISIDHAIAIVMSDPDYVSPFLKYPDIFNFPPESDYYNNYVKSFNHNPEPKYKYDPIKKWGLQIYRGFGPNPGKLK